MTTTISQTNITLKKMLFLFLFVATSLLAFLQCKKYPNEPVLGFRTKSEKVSNNWKVENQKTYLSGFNSFISNYNDAFSEKGFNDYVKSEHAKPMYWVLNSKKEISF